MFRPIALALSLAVVSTSALAQQNAQEGPVGEPTPVVQEPIQLFPPEGAVAGTGTAATTTATVATTTAFGSIALPLLGGTLLIGAIAGGGSTSDTQ